MPMPEKIDPRELAEFVERVMATSREDREQTREFLTRGDIDAVLNRLEADIERIERKKRK